jgi:hypothetical protein
MTGRKTLTPVMGRSHLLEMPKTFGTAAGSGLGSAKGFDVADQVVDLCPRQRQIRHRAVRM